mgnify:CR=1 FL=1
MKRIHKGVANKQEIHEELWNPSNEKPGPQTTVLFSFVVNGRVIQRLERMHHNQLTGVNSRSKRTQKKKKSGKAEPRGDIKGAEKAPSGFPGPGQANYCFSFSSSAFPCLSCLHIIIIILASPGFSSFLLFLLF